MDLRERPTALFVVNDLAAMGAMAAVEVRGLSVPDDISVVGYDGTRLAGIRPIGLTTVGQPLHEMGTRAAARLCGQLDGEVCGEAHTRLPPSLIERRTTARARLASSQPPVDKRTETLGLRRSSKLHAGR